MKINDVISYFETIVPLSYAEDFDNVGLLVGDKNSELTNILVTLDTLESVVDEAIAKNCNLIISFHPIIFKGLKKITGSNYVERTILKAIQNKIAIYAIHTAFDNAFLGVNDSICNQLQLTQKRILIPKTQTIKKLNTYVPKAHADVLRTALFKAGAGSLGNYTNCSFNTQGLGTFNPNTSAHPVLGKHGEDNTVEEVNISVTYAKHNEQNILTALFKTHPYDEAAYEISTLENENQHLGMGMIGTLKTTLSETEFLIFVKEKMQTPCIRHSSFTNKPIKTVAVLGGSGSFAIPAAIGANADVFITSDVKYHDFFTAENKLLILDIGHYESEQFTKNKIVALLKEKFTTFAIILSNTNTNPINYF